MDNQETSVLLFDGVCNLCNNIVQFIIKRDTKGKIKFAALQSESGQAFLNKFGLPTNHFDSLIFIKGEQYYQKSAAVLKILKEIGGIWILFYFLIIFPLPLRNFIYDMIVKYRYKIFGKREYCILPSPELKQRFL